MIRAGRDKFRFRYGYAAKNMTVTVQAPNEEVARYRARDKLDARYAKADREPPVAWTLLLEERWTPGTEIDWRPKP